MKLELVVYRGLELIDGEKIRGIKIIPYKLAERLKLLCLYKIAEKRG